MTGRERIEAAFSDGGSPELGAVVCYEGILFRDHWNDLTGIPWWHGSIPDVEVQLGWRRSAARKIGQDWFQIPLVPSSEERDGCVIEERSDGVYRVRGSFEELLTEPRIGGWEAGGGLHSVVREHPPLDREEIDLLIPDPPETDPEVILSDGRGDLARRILEDFGEDLFPIRHVMSPLWYCYDLWGFEGFMLAVADTPELVAHACRRALSRELRNVREAAIPGARGIWIEECMTDMIAPEAFRKLNLPHLRGLTEEIRRFGMSSIYYYCGNPEGKWDLIFDAGSDAVALEESKKGFTIDIEDVVERARGRCALLGNLDAISVLQNGTEDALRHEITRQLNAGRKNGGRFVMSIGSPVTPYTPVRRVRLFCDLVHELGSDR